MLATLLGVKKRGGSGSIAAHVSWNKNHCVSTPMMQRMVHPSIWHAHRLESRSIAARVSWNDMRFVSTPRRQGIVHRSIHHHHLLVTKCSTSTLDPSSFGSQKPPDAHAAIPRRRLHRHLHLHLHLHRHLHPNEISNLISTTQIIHPSLWSDIHHRGLAVVKRNEGQCHIVSLLQVTTGVTHHAAQRSSTLGSKDQTGKSVPGKLARMLTCCSLFPAAAANADPEPFRSEPLQSLPHIRALGSLTE